MHQWDELHNVERIQERINTVMIDGQSVQDENIGIETKQKKQGIRMRERTAGKSEVNIQDSGRTVAEW